MSELGDLIEAASLSPGKSGLLRAVIRAANEAIEPEEASRWLSVIEPAQYDIDARIMAGEFLSDQGEVSSALRWVIGDDSRLCVARARILHEAGRTGEAAEAYRSGVMADPGSRDEELDAALAPKQAAAASNVVNLRGGRNGQEQE